MTCPSALALQAAVIGASRADASSYFFPTIAHYAYGEDTALHIAGAAYATKVAQQLVALGANVHAKNRRGAEPLHYAADGSPESASWDPVAQARTIEFLLKAGADPNATDKSGVAPLHRAVRTRSTAAVEALLTGGADARSRNNGGSTPLHLAVQATGRGGSGSPAAREAQAQIVRVLLRHGARPSDKNTAGTTVSDSAKSDWVRALLDEG